MKTEKRRKEKNGGLSEDQIEFGKYAFVSWLSVALLLRMDRSKR